MSKVIDLTRAHSDFVNVPDAFEVGAFPHDEPGETYQSVEKYWLPEGYTVRETVVGDLAIYNARGEHCPLCRPRSLTMKNFTHRTASGYCAVVDSWGHGKGARADWYHVPAILLSDDGDGHMTAIRYTGKAIDAAKVMAEFDNKDNNVVTFDGKWLRAEPIPDGFWIEKEDGDFEPNLADFPEVIAY